MALLYLTFNVYHILFHVMKYWQTARLWCILIVTVLHAGECVIIWKYLWRLWQYFDKELHEVACFTGFLFVSVLITLQSGRRRWVVSLCCILPLNTSCVSCSYLLILFSVPEQAFKFIMIHCTRDCRCFVGVIYYYRLLHFANNVVRIRMLGSIKSQRQKDWCSGSVMPEEDPWYTLVPPRF